MKHYLFLAFLFIAVMLIWFNLELFYEWAKTAKITVDEFPVASGIGFILFYCLLIPFSFPALLMNGFGAFLFGFQTAVVLNICGSVLSSAVSFIYAEKMIRSDATEKILNTIKTKFPQFDRTVGWYEVALVRSMMMPFTAVSYTMGIIGVSFWPYLLGTLIGSAPGTIINTYFIGQSFEWITTGDWFSERQIFSFLMSFGLIGLLGVVRFFILKFLSHHRC